MARNSILISDKDKGWKELGENVAKLSLSGAYALVGVQGPKAAANHQGGALTVAEIATVHEFGATIVQRGRTITIPERSFIRGAIDQFQNAIQKRATMLGTGVVLMKITAAGAIEALGQYAQGVMVQRIADRIAPPNRPSTIARKRSSVPLIDTDQLRGSITHKAEAAY